MRRLWYVGALTVGAGWFVALGLFAFMLLLVEVERDWRPVEIVGLGATASAATLATVVAVVTFIGLGLPRPAWAFTHWVRLVALALVGAVHAVVAWVLVVLPAVRTDDAGSAPSGALVALVMVESLVLGLGIRRVRYADEQTDRRVG